MRAPLQTIFALVALTWASGAMAGTHASIPAGGGLPALDVKVDLAAAVVRANSVEAPIGLEPSLLADEADVVVEAVALGAGRSLIHVRVPERGSDPSGPAWEALFAAGRSEPIFSGMTGLTKGDPGERTGAAIRIVPRGAAFQVLVGSIREDLRICGQTETLLDPRVVVPTSLDLKASAALPLSDAERAHATPLAAVDKGPTFETALGKLLVARGSSSGDSWGLELTDGNPRTVWREKRPGGSQGAFVLMAAPKEVPISRIQLAVSSPDAASAGAVPKAFYLVTGTRSYRLSLPGAAARKPGEVFEVVFPEPVESSCVALVLDTPNVAGDARTNGGGVGVVGVAEMTAFSDFDAPGATLDAVAETLSGPRGAAAAQLLERSGPAGLAAVSKAYARMEPRGRALAIDVAAASDRCEDAGPLLAQALCEKEGEAPRRALEKLQRCPAAASALAHTLRTEPSSRTCVAPLLSTLSPAAALEPIADALGEVPETDFATRAILRAAFGRALGGAGSGHLGSLLSDSSRALAARLEILRAAEAHVVESASSADALVAALMKASPPLRVRYLVLDPLASLAQSGDSAAIARLVEALARDPDWPVRAHAAELSGGLAPVTDALVSAARDPEPRVRAAALTALTSTPPQGAVQAAIAAMAGDNWSFVKMQAASLLAHAPVSEHVDDALGRSLGDPVVSVRGAALVALARRRALGWRQAIRDRLDDEAEDIHLRAAAASALGAICDVSATDRLTELARDLASGARGDDVPLGLGALVGLAGLHPVDLQARLVPLLSKSVAPFVRAAAERALAAHGVCR
jgi:HEAT repeat protein